MAFVDFPLSPDSSRLEAWVRGAYKKKLDHQLEQGDLYAIIINDYNMDNEGVFEILFSKIPYGSLCIVQFISTKWE